MLGKLLLTLLFLSGGALVFASATYSVNKSSCAKVDERISNINSQMRLGYTSKEGESFRDDLRKLKKQRARCKSKKYPTSSE